MNTMKLFLKILLCLIIFYFIVSFLSYGYILKAYRMIDDYEILAEKPKIEILECKGTYMNGYVVGTVTNNTESIINPQYIKIDCYNKRNTKVASTYVELTDFKQGETKEFKANFRGDGVVKVKLSVVEETPPIIEKDKKYNIYPFLLGILIVLILYIG